MAQNKDTIKVRVILGRGYWLLLISYSIDVSAVAIVSSPRIMHASTGVGVTALAGVVVACRPVHAEHPLQTLPERGFLNDDGTAVSNKI